MTTPRGKRSGCASRIPSQRKTWSITISVVAGGEGEQVDKGCNTIFDCRKFVGNFLSDNRSSKIQNLELKPPFYVNLKTESKFWVPMISSVKNSQLSDGILSENCSLLPRLLFLAHDACRCMSMITGMKIIPCLQDQANIKQASSKHRANVEQTSNN